MSGGKRLTAAVTMERVVTVCLTREEIETLMDAAIEARGKFSTTRPLLAQFGGDGVRIDMRLDTLNSRPT